MRLTVKQIELLTVIAKGNGPDDPCDLDQILDEIRYETTKQSLQFSIRALVAHGLIFRKGTESRRGRQRQVIEATSLGRAVVSPAGASSAPAYVSSVEEDELQSVIGD
ncbi:hypothetical protein LP414_27740 [Polaromonas sp. P1(28)-13]|nr:hypothetical protein LP414_27740 [Polaromonas sp. P1(28)-13]